MDTEHAIARHYAHGSLEQAILDALAAAGKDADHLSPADLAPVDEFHIGGRAATIEFAAQLGVHGGMRLLDVGCGLGGAARYFAHEHGCHVTGIDLSGEYVAVANALAARVGLGERVSYLQASALDLPFTPESFDAVYLFHVGMNIEDKGRMFAGIQRVLAPSGVHGIDDVMRTGPGELSLPVPWASSAEACFVADPPTYRQLLQAAGFDVRKERNRRDFALDVFQKMRARGAPGRPAPLGLHIVMGANAAQKIANMVGDIGRGVIAPVEMICQAVS